MTDDGVIEDVRKHMNEVYLCFIIICSIIITGTVAIGGSTSVLRDDSSAGFTAPGAGRAAGTGE
jgi:hypothetical protein